MLKTPRRWLLTGRTRRGTSLFHWNYCAESTHKNGNILSTCSLDVQILLSQNSSNRLVVQSVTEQVIVKCHNSLTKVERMLEVMHRNITE